MWLLACPKCRFHHLFARVQPFLPSNSERIIEDLNVQSATSTTRSPTMVRAVVFRATRSITEVVWLTQGDLQEEIDLLKKDVEATKAAQKKQVDGLRNNVKNEVKDQITKALRYGSSRWLTHQIADAHSTIGQKLREKSRNRLKRR
jgi:hypothetical protein